MQRNKRISTSGSHYLLWYNLDHVWTARYDCWRIISGPRYVQPSRKKQTSPPANIGTPTEEKETVNIKHQ